MKAATGATPLTALEAIAFDSETTGLDTNTARIVQMAAIGMSRGHVVGNERFETLVDPRIAIPPASTKIHGITNALVRNAADFTPAYRALEKFRHGRVVVGYALGFDFAILEREWAART